MRGVARILFRYELQAQDMDADGSGISADALMLNSGTISNPGGANADLNLGEHAIANAGGHVVDGSMPATLVGRGSREFDLIAPCCC